MHEERIAVIEILLGELIDEFAIATDDYIAGRTSERQFEKIRTKFMDDSKKLVDELAQIEHERKTS